MMMVMAVDIKRAVPFLVSSGRKFQSTQFVCQSIRGIRHQLRPESIWWRGERENRNSTSVGIH